MSGSSANRLRIPRPLPSRPRDPSQPRARLVGAPPPPPPAASWCSCWKMQQRWRGRAAGTLQFPGEAVSGARCSPPVREPPLPGADAASGGAGGRHWGTLGTQPRRPELSPLSHCARIQQRRPRNGGRCGITLKDGGKSLLRLFLACSRLFECTVTTTARFLRSVSAGVFELVIVINCDKVYKSS